MMDVNESRPVSPSGKSTLPNAETLVELTSFQQASICVLLFIPLFIAIYLASFLLIFQGQLDTEKWIAFGLTVAGVVLVKIIVFLWFRVHHALGRYVAFHDLLTIIKAATVSLLSLGFIIYLLGTRQSEGAAQSIIPVPVLVLDWGATIMVVGGLLAVLRFLHENNWPPFAFFSKKTPTLIVGANEAGESLLYALLRNRKMNYHVVGFIDEDPDRVDTRVGSARVLGTVPDTCHIAEKFGVKEILITTDGLSGRQMRHLVEEARQREMTVKVLPTYEQLIQGRLAVQPRAVNIEDLLRREPVQLELENLRQWLDNRVLMVTGSAGSIGSEICRQLLKFSPKRLIMIDRWETGQFFLEHELNLLCQNNGIHVDLDVQMADLLEKKRIKELLETYRPDIVFHAAAYKHVPLMEKHPYESVKNIVLATRNLADTARETGVASLVMISTDKAVNPTNVMGACKRVAELYVQ
jgi:FlaA1/EpsC-like NDP-sugar epimerase